ncbi:hypothetical protein [Sphingobacterium chungjuense]|uniref:hypothetical protein n=1 Tax=Sphingobacterium chungjuense TaxID=2675553 RepID=UPI001407DDA4|nr:hypothetical protein [Sphingobacterium chungjuense]
MDVPSVPISSAADDNNAYRTVVLEGIPARENLSIEFISLGTANTVGFRLDNIRITAQSTDTSGGPPIILTPDN